ncbi:glycosyltransferase family 90 protein [Lasiosphaeris hirsuta]|uniref:Glycosyltransferase family 90 protein n=1 Tax=Lasiosphaeris hirsuta TaxID=260670 RepID=A0AA40E7Q7_9PEZI|nr:glycosyltransferase family 90 protein [Lasiosphaeris hirsuta]
MASNGGSQLTALCAVTSFFWLAHSLESHQLTEQPRLSSLLILLISGISAFATSFFALWLPGANGRFDDDSGPLRVPRPNLPKKPRRYFLPMLVICILLRLEIFHRVSFDLQCSRSGIEAWLPLVILLYDLSSRKPRLTPNAEDKDYDDMGNTIFDAIGDWVSDWANHSGSGLGVVTFAFTYGTYLASSQGSRSTFFCSSQDNSPLVVFLQWIGLLLDAAIIILLWRVISWARTTRVRLRTMSGVLLASALGTALLSWPSFLFKQSRPMSYHFRGLDSLYVFDILVDGLTFSVFFVSTGLLLAEGSPLSLTGIVTFISGLLMALYNMMLVGSWENVTPSKTYFSLVLICLGFSFFVFMNNIRSVVFIHRAIVVFFLILLTVAATIFSIIMTHKAQVDSHPLERLVYDARVEAGRWVVHATTSNSLVVAVQEYKERHNGREPPPKFDIWYQFAKDRKSPIMDHFAQMERDIIPFWGITPEKIREDTRRVASEPDIAIIKIQNGTANHKVPADSPHKAVIDNLAKMIKTFAEHLPDFEFAVNMNSRPRVLAPWEDVRRFTVAGRQKGLTRMLSRRSVPVENEALPTSSATPDSVITRKDFTTVRAFREMTALTCPPGTRTRSGAHWDVRDFCSSCADPHSQGTQDLRDWPLSQELCHQSDLLRLHGFHMTPPELRPMQELLPVFSASKTGSYSDILIPLHHTDERPSGSDRAFEMKRQGLFWRGSLDSHLAGSNSHELLRGGHQERLVHLANNASSADKTTILLPSSTDTDRFACEEVSTAELNALLPIDIGFTQSTCKDCDDEVARREFGVKPKADQDAAEAQLMHQYVLVVDTNDGPPQDLLPILRSASAPFQASIFKEWYSERLMAWIHFVPVDLRFHALHSTLAYFTGFNNNNQKDMVNGRKVKMAPRLEEGRWIAEQGRRWANTAIRREDMEIYLFRLLLEWGRVVDNRREEIGFVL